MKRIFVGLLACFALLGVGLANADEGQTRKKEQPTGGAAEAGREAMVAPSELTGRVVQTKADKVYIEHMGAVVPLKIDERTKFEGGIKSARDLKEGQEVRASFTIKDKTENVVQTLMPTTPMMPPARGGAGAPSPEEPGTQQQR